MLISELAPSVLQKADLSGPLAVEPALSTGPHITDLGVQWLASLTLVVCDILALYAVAHHQTFSLSLTTHTGTLKSFNKKTLKSEGHSKLIIV